MIHPDSLRSGAGFDVITTICCMSRQERSGLASKAKAQRPDANGADAEVPITFLFFVNLVNLLISLRIDCGFNNFRMTN